MSDVKIDEMLEVPCIVVGGAADGTLINVRMDAERIKLSTPSHAKPLESSTQKDIVVEELADIYTVHPIGLQDNDDMPEMIYAIAAPEGMTISQAFQTLIRSHVMYTAEVDWNNQSEIQTQ